MSISKIIILGVILFLSSCGCKNYTIANAKNPVITHHKGSRLLKLCKNIEVIVGIANVEKYFVGEYNLPNDSIATGYIAGISFLDNKKERIVIGKGSEFSAGKCKFRVLEVDPYYHFDSLTNDVWGESITLQTISYPKFCPCQNAQLRRYEKKNP